MFLRISEQRVFWVSTVTLSVIFFVVRLSAQSQTVDLKDAELVEQGSELYSKSCAVGYCHGLEGRTFGAPKLRERDWEPRQLSETIQNGVPGTTMPAFRGVLADRDIWNIVAYIMTLSTTELSASDAVVEIGAVTKVKKPLSEKEKLGFDLFFDLHNAKRCSVCHLLGEWGTAIGPDLAHEAEEHSAEQLLSNIVEPDAGIAGGFEQTIVVTQQGERIAGIKKEQTDEFIRIYDTTTFPVPLRTLYKEEIKSVTTKKKSAMPSDYGGMYSPEELDAIVAYLKSGKF